MDWEQNYGRIGFGAGFAGAARPFGAENKPVLNLSVSDHNGLANFNHIPNFFNNNGQIVLWEDDYSKPLPLNRQFYNPAQKKFQKRNYVKRHNDLTDTVTERKPPRGNYAARKERREARLDANPFLNTGIGPQTARLDNKDVQRDRFAELNEDLNFALMNLV